MPYDEKLAGRLAQLAQGRPELVEKKMFGGIGYMLNGNMRCGIYKEFLVLRLGVEQAESVLSEPHAKPMDITGKVMKGWALIAPEGIAKDKDLKRYVQLAQNFAATLAAK